MILFHKSFAPSFWLGYPNQTPVAIYTVLSINEQVRDCAAYRGIGPALPVEDERLHEAVRAGGEKVTETEARELFPEIEMMHLRYRW